MFVCNDIINNCIELKIPARKFQTTKQLVNDTDCADMADYARGYSFVVRIHNAVVFVMFGIRNRRRWWGNEAFLLLVFCE